MALSRSAVFSLLPSRRSSGASSRLVLSCKAGSVRLSPMASMRVASPARGISETFDRLRKQGKVAFIPYICAGDPDLSTTSEALKVLDSCGSDIIELGMPYSDPLADGPVIQAAATRALAKGTTFNGVISMLKEVIPQISCPIALFTYYNPILKRGVEKFMSTVKDVGVHGLLIPDIPLEETTTLREEAAKHNLELVLLTTPTTPTERMKSIVNASEGFVYLVSSVGVTGARPTVSNHVQHLIKEIKRRLQQQYGFNDPVYLVFLSYFAALSSFKIVIPRDAYRKTPSPRLATTKPVAVGFGISKPEHVQQVAGWGADGVIIGSAIVRLLGEAKTPEEGLKNLETFTKSLTAALP